MGSQFKWNPWAAILILGYHTALSHLFYCQIWNWKLKIISLSWAWRNLYICIFIGRSALSCNEVSNLRPKHYLVFGLTFIIQIHTVFAREIMSSMTRTTCLAFSACHLKKLNQIHSRNSVPRLAAFHEILFVHLLMTIRNDDWGLGGLKKLSKLGSFTTSCHGTQQVVT